MTPASHRPLKAAASRRERVSVRLCGRHTLPCFLFACSLATCAGCTGFFSGGFLPEPDDGTPDIQVNGCGPSGILGLLVPECPLRLACFTPACNNHDLCYDTCGTSRDTCDAAFHQDMLDICAAGFAEGSGARRRCEVLAYIYWQVVARFGQQFFDRGRQETCALEPSPDTVRATTTQSEATWAVFRPFDDEDDDLLPDDWELSVGLDPADPADAWFDNDADGLINLQEFILETDPMNPDAG